MDYILDTEAHREVTEDGENNCIYWNECEAICRISQLREDAREHNAICNFNFESCPFYKDKTETVFPTLELLKELLRKQ